jgi:hypothetical protein
VAAPYRTAPPRRLTVPVLPVRNAVLLPGQTLELTVGRARSLAAVTAASETELLVLAQTAGATEEPDPAKGDLAGIGTVGRIIQIIRLTDHSVVTVQGTERVRVIAWPQREPFLVADAEELDAGGDADGPERAGAVWQRSGHMWIAPADRQRLLEAPTTAARLALIDELRARDAARPPAARVLETPVRVDLEWAGELPEPTSRALGVAIAALGKVASLVEARSALVYGIPPDGDQESVQRFTAGGRLDARAMRRLVGRALGRRPQSALGYFLWPRREPLVVPILEVGRARLRLPGPVAGDGRFELDTPVGRVDMACLRRGEQTWVETPDDPDQADEEHIWEPVRIQVRVAEELSIRFWSRWALWGGGDEPVLLEEVVDMLCRRGAWRVAD